MHAPLTGRSILIVEDEPLIVMDITKAFEGTGAELTTTNTLRHALILVEHDGLSGAILDHALGDGNSSLLCARLTERGIPYFIYSGFDTVDGACKGAPHVGKPAAPGELVAKMEELIREATPADPPLQAAGDDYVADFRNSERSGSNPSLWEEPLMQNLVRELRSDFTAAISSKQNDVTLDPSIAVLKQKLSEQAFLGEFSIYSRGHLRKMDSFLCRISKAHLKDDPLQVALAVDSILKLFDSLELTVKQSEAANQGIEARRSS